MTGAAGRRWPLVAAVASVLALVAGVGWAVLAWVRGGTDAAPHTVVGFALSVVGAVLGLIGWARKRRRQASLPATADQVDQAAATLAGLVFEQWDAEARARSLGDPEPMPVRWRLTSPDLMDHPRMITVDGELAFAGRSDQIGPLTEAFRALPRRRLVITGGPGTGKTTLAVQLLLELLAHRRPGEPVPVLFSLVSWSPDSQPHVQDWLTAQLEQGYPALRAIAADAAAALVAQARILPVLDGLDEVAPVRRAGIVAALNSSLAPDSGLILTSRRGEYRTAVKAAGDVLTAAAVIAPLTLTRGDAAAYLRSHLPPQPGPAWKQLLAALEGGGAPQLAAVAATPLGLWLVRTVYIDGRLDPAGLADATHPTRAALQAHLLTELIPAVIRRRAPSPRRRREAPDAPLRPTRSYRPDEMRRWLTTIAEQLRDAGTRDWLWWQLARHAFPTKHGPRIAFGLAVGLVAGLMFGLTVGVPIALEVVATYSFVAGELIIFTVIISVMMTGLPTGLLFGSMAWLVVPPTISPKHANLRLRGRVTELMRTAARGLPVGLAVTLPLVLLATGANFVSELLEPVRFLAWMAQLWLLLGTTVGLVIGLQRFVSSEDAAQRSTSPAGSYRGDRARALVGLLGTGLALVLARATFDGPGVVLLFVSVPATAVAIGLVIALARDAWPLFILASTWRALRRKLPRPSRVMPFLDDATDWGCCAPWARPTSSGTPSCRTTSPRPP